MGQYNLNRLYGTWRQRRQDTNAQVGSDYDRDGFGTGRAIKKPSEQQ